MRCWALGLQRCLPEPLFSLCYLIFCGCADSSVSGLARGLDVTGLMYHLTSYMDTMIFSKLCYLDMTFYSDDIWMDHALGGGGGAHWPNG